MILSQNNSDIETEKTRKSNDRLAIQASDKASGLGSIAIMLFAFFLGADKKSFEKGGAVEQVADSFGLDKEKLTQTTNDVISGKTTAFNAAVTTVESIDTSSINIADAKKVIEKYTPIDNPLINLITSKESNDDYNRVYGKGVKRENLTKMSINEVIAWQKNYTENEGSYSSAVGRYQIIRKTLEHQKGVLGLTGDELFDEEMQDRIAMSLLEGRGYTDYLNGYIDDKTFMRNLSQEWAAMPEDERGLSYYDKDGVNKALVTPETLLLAMHQTKNKFLSQQQSPNQKIFNSGGVVVADAQQPDPLPFDGIGVDQIALEADIDSANEATHAAPSTSTLSRG